MTNNGLGAFFKNSTTTKQKKLTWKSNRDLWHRSLIYYFSVTKPADHTGRSRAVYGAGPVTNISLTTSKKK